MDKLRTKRIWQAEGLPTPAYAVLEKNTDLAAVAKKLGLPLMVKPASEGSSVGMSKVRKAGAPDEAYALAANHDRGGIAGEVNQGPELTVGHLRQQVRPVLKPATPPPFY